MSCPQFDWKAYTLGELSAVQKREAETHAASCSDCRMEVASLRLTLDAMSTLREEEVPHRIAFVSDKVFEPRWWQQLWNPTFAAACVVAAAILVHAFKESPVNAQLQQAQIDAAVARAVADVEMRQQAAYEIMDKQMKQMYITTAGMVRQ
jgi:anti-sigma-K factor RskA